VSRKLIISTGETSGELYGILLSKEIRNLWPEVKIFGIGGHRMRAEGINLIAESSHIIGITEAIVHLGRVWRSFKRATEALRSLRPDVLVLIDYPDFNLAFAKRAKEMGIPVLYYVSPQIWAWRKRRSRKMASLVNRVALILPFEVDYYMDKGIECEFVGHPVTETLKIRGSKESIREEIGLDPERPLITLLPGSRPIEIQRHMPVLKETASMIHREMPDYQIAIPVTEETELNMEIEDYIKVLRGRTIEALASSDASAIASGTATLEAALLGVPMVVFYRTSYLTYMIARLMVRIKYISLVNLISGRKVVTELIQDRAKPENIFHELMKIIQDDSYRKNIVSGLKMIKNIMQDKRPSHRVAQITGEIAGWSNTSVS
jgi:lipid-A-disaccharide synthase